MLCLIGIICNEEYILVIILKSSWDVIFFLSVYRRFVVGRLGIFYSMEDIFVFFF